MNGHYSIIAIDAHPAQLGAATKEALDKSEQDLPVPDPAANPMSALLAALGLKSYAAYANGSKSVGVDRDTELRLRPTRNRGARHGFEEIEGAEMLIPVDVADDVLGASVLDALATSA